jgi:hypothetical protein
MFYQYSYATCFDHNFGHHQALNEHSQVIKHIGYNTDPYLLTDYCVANISWECIYKVTIMIKVYKTFSLINVNVKNLT